MHSAESVVTVALNCIVLEESPGNDCKMLPKVVKAVHVALWSYTVYLAAYLHQKLLALVDEISRPEKYSRTDRKSVV